MEFQCFKNTVLGRQALEMYQFKIIRTLGRWGQKEKNWDSWNSINNKILLKIKY